MSADPQWRDRLVELHVLAESGDEAAAALATGWLARDPDARAAWEEVTRACASVRAAADLPGR